MAKIRLLIVDDSRTIQLILSAVLGDDPDIVVVGTASGAEQAEAFFRNGRIDAVTLDVEMPGIGGLDYLRTLRKRAVPVVMVSTRVGKNDPVRAEALRRGAAACFPKAEVFARPAQFRELVKAAAGREVKLDRRDAALAAARAA